LLSISQREEIQTALGIPLETKVHLVTLRDCLFAHDHHEVLPDEFNKPDILEKAEIAALKIMDHVFSGYHHTRFMNSILTVHSKLN